MNQLITVGRQFLRKISRVMNYPTVTIEYPFVSKPLVKLARLAIGNNFNECTACRECEKQCPTQAIRIQMDEYSPQSRKPQNSKSQDILGVLNSFKIDYQACVSCGICVEICPAQSLFFDKTYRRPEPKKESLQVDLIHIPRSMRKE